MVNAFRIPLLLAAGLALVGAACSGGDSKPATPAASASPPPVACVIDAAVCAFAARVEYEFREGDPRTLVSPKSDYYPDTGIVTAGPVKLQTASTLPRVIAIGCPVDAGTPTCADAFSLVITAAPAGMELQGQVRVLLGFVRDGNDLPIVTVNALVPGFPELLSGGKPPSCTFSGRKLTPGQCVETYFYPFSSGPVLAAVPTRTPLPTPATDPAGNVETVPLKVGMQASIGYDTVVYYSVGCFACGRPQIPNLYRYYLDSSGKAHTDDLFGPLLTRTGGYPDDVAADWEHGHLLVKICATGYCGGESDPSPDATVRVFRSHDGGVTFTEEASPGLPVESFLVGFAGDQAIAGALDRHGLDFRIRYFLYPSGKALAPPAEAGAANPVADPAIGIGWRNTDSGAGYFDSSGKLLVAGASGKRLVGIVPLTVGRLAEWLDDAGHQYSYGLYDGTGALVRVFQWDRFIDLRGQLPSGYFFGNVELGVPFGFGVDASSAACKQNQPVYASLINWATATIHPVVDFGECPPNRGHVFVNAMVAWSVVRVASGSDCLNVRAEPRTDSASLGCFADGVLLGLFFGPDGPPPVAGWLRVVTPSLESGWVSEEFVTH